MSPSRRPTVGERLLARLRVALGALGLTLACFLVLPLIQAIARPPEAELSVRALDIADAPPPPPPPEPEPEDEPEEPPPPELVEEQEPLDLASLEEALNPGFGEGFMGGELAVRLTAVAGRKQDIEELFSLADLDQRPRVLHQPAPTLDAELRRKAPATVHIVFMVDARGSVENPVVQQSTDPLFERPALAAVKQWKFEPGRRNGQAVRFRMRVPITFPKE